MSAYVTTVPVRFGHVDPAGIVYFPRIFDYIHDAFESMWEEHVGQRYYQLLLERRIGFPLVHSEVDFKSPLRFGASPEVRITCFRLGTTSLGMRYRFSLDGVESIDARMTTVCVHTKSMEKQPIPDEFRPHFESIRETL